MNKRNTIILALLFLIVMVQIVVLAPKQTGPPEPEVAENEDAAPTPKKTDMGGQVMQKLHLVETKTSGREWELWASEAARPKDSERWTMKDVKVRFFGLNGVSYDVTGEQGVVNPQKNEMRIDGNVITHSTNGYVFTTDTAIYDSLSHVLKSPHRVKMVGPSDKTSDGKENSGLVLTGEDMVANMQSNEIKIGRKVHAKKGVQGNKIATIQSQHAEFSGKTNLAHFMGEVVMDVETMRVTGPEARFAFNPASGSLDSVDVTGGIRVTDTDKYATSQQVSVQFVENQVVFNGSPRVVQNGDEVVGDQIVFADGGKRVRVSNMRGQIEPETMQRQGASFGASGVSQKPAAASSGSGESARVSQPAGSAVGPVGEKRN